MRDSRPAGDLSAHIVPLRSRRSPCRLKFNRFITAIFTIGSDSGFAGEGGRNPLVAKVSKALHALTLAHGTLTIEATGWEKYHFPSHTHASRSKAAEAAPVLGAELKSRIMLTLQMMPQRVFSIETEHSPVVLRI